MDYDCTCETDTVRVNSTLKGTIGYMSDEELSCHYFNGCCVIVLEEMGFWVGVVQTIFAIGGILANIISSVILASKGTHFLPNARFH